RTERPDCRSVLPLRTGRAGFPHPALTILSSQAFTSTHAAIESQGRQPQTVELCVPTDPAGHPEGTLAPTFQVFFQSRPHIMVDLAKRIAGITQTEVIAPASQMGVDLTDQRRDRHEAFVRSSHLPQLVPFPLHRLDRRTEVQIAPIPAMAVLVVPEHVAKEVQAFAFVLQLDRTCLLTVDSKTQPRLQRLFHELRNPTAHAPCQNHKV